MPPSCTQAALIIKYSTNNRTIFHAEAYTALLDGNRASFQVTECVGFGEEWRNTMRASFGTLGVALLLCLAPGPLLFAQAPQAADGLLAEPFAAAGPPEVRQPTTEAQAVQASGAPPAQPAVSVVTLLGLDERQVARLDRLYDDYARDRLTQQEIIRPKEEDLAAAQSPTSFDERRAGRLVKDIAGTEQKVAEAFLKAQAAALRLLPAGQRAQVEGLRAAPPGRPRRQVPRVTAATGPEFVAGAGGDRDHSPVIGKWHFAIGAPGGLRRSWLLPPFRLRPALLSPILSVSLKPVVRLPDRVWGAVWLSVRVCRPPRGRSRRP